MYGTKVKESDLSLGLLQTYLMDHEEFHNRAQTFRGTSLDTLETVLMVTLPDTVRYLTDRSALAFFMDMPDYVVWSAHTPIAWHSTTRGITHRTDKSSWEWVSAEVRVWENPQTIHRFNRLAYVVSQINSPTATR